MANKAGYAGWMNEWENKQDKEGVVDMNKQDGWANLNKEDKKDVVEIAVSKIMYNTITEALGFISLVGESKYITDENDKMCGNLTEEYESLDKAVVLAVIAELANHLR